MVEPEPPEALAETPTEAAADATDGSSSGLSEHPLVEGLLSTEPSEAAETPAELATRGIKKFIRGALGARVKSGQTAAEDLLHAGIGFYRQPEETAENGQQPGQQPRNEQEMVEHWERDKDS